MTRISSASMNHTNQIISGYLASSRSVMLPTADNNAPCVLSAFRFNALRSSSPTRLVLPRVGRRTHGTFLREASGTHNRWRGASISGVIRPTAGAQRSRPREPAKASRLFALSRSLRVGFPVRHLSRNLLARHLARDVSDGLLVAPLGFPLLPPPLFFALLSRSPVPVA
jgi:hypothetical protein